MCCINILNFIRFSLEVSVVRNIPSLSGQNIVFLSGLLNDYLACNGPETLYFLALIYVSGVEMLSVGEPDNLADNNHM